MSPQPGDTAVRGGRCRGGCAGGWAGSAGAGLAVPGLCPPARSPPGPGAAVPVPRVTPSGRRRGARRCDVTARDVSSLTRCDEHASDTAAEAVQSGVPGVSGRSRLRSLPKLLRSGGREGVRPTRSAAPLPAICCSHPRVLPHRLLELTPRRAGKRGRACLISLLGVPVPAVPVLPRVPALRGRRRVDHPQSTSFDLARSPPGRCHYLHVTAFYFCLGVMKEVSFPWNLISRLRLSD